MVFSSNLVWSLVGWLAERVGLTFDLPADLLAEPIDGREIVEQLRYGRD